MFRRVSRILRMSIIEDYYVGQYVSRVTRFQAFSRAPFGDSNVQAPPRSVFRRFERTVILPKWIGTYVHIRVYLFYNDLCQKRNEARVLVIHTRGMKFFILWWRADRTFVTCHLVHSTSVSLEFFATTKQCVHASLCEKEFIKRTLYRLDGIG